MCVDRHQRLHGVADVCGDSSRWLSQRYLVGVDVVLRVAATQETGRLPVSKAGARTMYAALGQPVPVRRNGGGGTSGTGTGCIQTGYCCRLALGCLSGPGGWPSAPAVEGRALAAAKGT